MNRRALVLALVLAGCAAEETAPPPPAPVDGPRAYVAATGPAQPAATARRKATQVVINVSRADLAAHVLPMFEQQVGVRITWVGEPRPVTLRMSRPMEWEDALSLVCQFTRTHPTKDYKGNLVLKDGWGGELGDGDLQQLQQQSEARRSVNAGRGGPSGPAWDDGQRRTSGGAGGTPQPTGAYSGGDEANRLLKGANTRTSPR